MKDTNVRISALKNTEYFLIYETNPDGAEHCSDGFGLFGSGTD